MFGRWQILDGDCLAVLRTLPDKSVHTVVTSPPYWGLRDYGVDGQIGLERTPDEYVTNMVVVFREVRRVLRDDGTLWLNLGDCFATGAQSAGNNPGGGRQGARWRGDLSKHDVAKRHRDGKRRDHSRPKTNGRGEAQVQAGVRVGPMTQPNRLPLPGLKPKDLVGMPWRVAFALQADGWYLRMDIIWCLSGGAWVYARTQKGDMPVMVKDLVRLNPRTVQLWNGDKWTRVVGWGQNPSPQKHIEIVLRSGERIGCTGTHQWPTQRGNVAASDLRVGDVIKTCILPEPDNCSAPPFLTLDACWLLGLYLAEGSRSGDTVQLSLCADEVEWLPRIESVARHLGGTMTHTVQGNNLSVRLYGRVLAAMIEEYVGGKTSHDVHLRVPTWRLPNRHLRAIADGYLAGDGHADVDNDRIRLGFTRNYSLERDLRTMAARLAATITLNPTTATYQGGERPAFRGEWRWSRRGHFNERDRGEVVAITGSRARQFWDIAVEDEPHLFALASGVLTHNCKSNPMPESVTDRPTKAHEYVFLLSKNEHYYYDAEAIKEPVSGTAHPRGYGFHPKTAAPGSGVKANASFEMAVTELVTDRNRRSVWTIATEPFGGAHFATFPTELVKPCIFAGTSERGCCPRCHAPFERITEKSDPIDDRGGRRKQANVMRRVGATSAFVTGEHQSTRTIAWQPTCYCEHAPGYPPPVPCTVLDPFNGAGTTGVVATRFGRDYIGIELNAEYAAMARRRIEGDAPLFNVGGGRC